MNAYYKNSRDKLISYKGNYEPVKVVDKISYTEKIVNNNPSQFKTEYKKSLINLDLKGKTDQKSYNGYNLANVSDDTLVKVQGSVINLGNNIVTIKGVDNSTYTAIYFEIPNPQDLLNKTITLSAKYSSTNADNRPAIRMIGYNGTTISASFGTDIYSVAPAQSTAGEIKVTANVAKIPDFTEYPNGAYCLLLYSNWNEKGNSLGEITFTDVMLQLGDKVLAYEPYVGGKPSPNAEYPQPINSSSNIELMLSGGNLLNQDLFLENTDVEKIGTAYSFKGHPVTYYQGSNREKLLNHIKSILKPNVKYTIASRFLSRQGGGTNNQGRLQFNDKIGGGAQIFALTNYRIDTTSLATVSFTQENIDSILSVWIYGSNPSVSNVPTIGNIIIINGEYTAETLPPFDEPYVEPITVELTGIELNKTSDWLDNTEERADSIVVDYINETVNLEIKCVKLDLATKITQDAVRVINGQGINIGVVRLPSLDSLENGMKAFCTHFTWSYGSLDGNVFDYSTSDVGTEVYFYNIEQTNATDFYNFLVENNVQIVGALDKPYTISMTSTQFGQELLNLSPVRNQTNVITITSDLPISEQNIKFAKWSVNQ